MELKIFDCFPEPVLFLQDEQIQYSNPALLALEPLWKAGAPLPPALRAQPEHQGVLLCGAGQRQFQGTISRLDQGFLLILRPAAQPPEAQRSLLPALLREQTQVILTALHGLERDVREDAAERTAQNAAMLRQSAASLLRLTHHLELAQCIIRQEPPELNEQTVDVAELCQNLTQCVQELIYGLGIDFQVKLPAGMVCRTADRKLLETMVLELLSNAVKAVRNGGEIGLRLSVESNIIITVWDSGPGLSQQELANFLNPLPPQELPKAGTGLRLGLPIARYAAQAHGGTLLLENRKEHGLTVTVSLPKKHTAAMVLHSPRRSDSMEERSHILTALADALPWQAFLLV